MRSLEFLPLYFRPAQRRALLGAGLLVGASVCWAQATGKLNDSGFARCGNQTSNDVGCSYLDNDPLGFPRQDGQIGRSAKEVAAGGTEAAARTALGKIGTSTSPGFDFSKVLGNGTVQNGALAAQTGVFSTAIAPAADTSWQCTKDNVTGLVWHLKTAATYTASGGSRTRDNYGYRLNANIYSWKKTSGNNGGNSGVPGGAVTGGSTSTTADCAVPVGGPGASYFCDTEAYATYVNSLSICGETANDWRLPTRLELLSIVDSYAPMVVNTSATGASGASTITVADASQLIARMYVDGLGIRAGATISSISGNTITLSGTNTAAVSGVVTFTREAAVDVVFFPNMRPSYYWTADSYAENNDEARFVTFGFGTDGTSPKGDKLHVILVRP